MKHGPQFPIYIVSKGRWESRQTMRVFESIGVPYRVVVEPQEREHYAAVIDPIKVLTLDMSYKDRYDTFSDLKAELGTGSGPARNFAWDHAVSEGFGWYWCVDDNIRSFHRVNNNMKIPVTDGAIFRCMEDFVLRYENVAMAGPNYFSFIPRKHAHWYRAFNINTRIYSCNLIRTDLPFRWRGRYNEDTDLSLRMLKAGWCTMLFNAFLQDKEVTLKMKGGNTDTIYRGKAGTISKAEMLCNMHPDVARMAKRFGRPHHVVDYSRFQTHNRLIRKEGPLPDREIDDYGMVMMPNPERKGLARMSESSKITA